MPISALIVRVPEAEEVVSDLRLIHDPSANEGVPAHITILVPFKEPHLLSPDDMARLSAVFLAQPSFEFSLGSIGRWPETTFLRPTQPERFVALTKAVVNEYPWLQPYEGKHDEIVPHLTVADGSMESAGAVEAKLSERIRRRGSIQARCGQVELLENSSGFWKVVHLFPLAERDA